MTYLSIFSKKFNTAQAIYEIIGCVLVIKHFRYMLKARHFAIYKPLIYVFRKKSDKLSPRQLQHLDFISQFTIDFRRVTGSNNSVG